MPSPETARAFYLRLQRLQLLLLASSRRAWAGMGADFDSSWSEVAPGLVTVTAAGQLAAARAATEYVPAVLEETGQPDQPEAQVRPQAFAGRAADGRSLGGLLYGAVVHAKTAAGTGAAPAVALEVGGRWLDTLVQTVTADAARQATQAEIAIRPDMGFLRMVNPPCCGRCAILAGRWYRYDAGFPRHPQCDCSAVPSTQEGWRQLSVSPTELFDRGDVRGLTRRERDRLAAGEDLHKVINESRDMWRARISEQRRQDKEAATAARLGMDLPATAAARDRQARQGLEDLFASTRSRIEALSAMKAQGFTQ
ncbi:VG15 protein [Modestobacter sp. VKM Ac-2985]|uniref:VG15 protein n=1 Tax=Modestobacter sp. VKM Ac-2985 TaxID=3004139 RepID=UPI0022AB572B|nr:hypothetical protein [Modestobacter sp. VKM Ac-2985]MCZ2837147.1 hypothetical protein [Modestobacter sp. VKM Ac-2985]